MATKKYDWKAIKRDYDNRKYKNNKELADAHGVNYGYLKKKASGWSREKVFVSPTTINTEPTCDMNREERVRSAYDKILDIALMALEDHEGNFFSGSGSLKAKTLADVAIVIEKVQKGYETGKEDKGLGKLQAFSGYLTSLREAYIEEVEQ